MSAHQAGGVGGGSGGTTYTAGSGISIVGTVISTTGGAASVTVGTGATAITGGTANRILFETSGNVLGESANLTWNGTTFAVTGAATVSTTLAVTGAASLNGGASSTVTDANNTSQVTAFTIAHLSSGGGGSSAMATALDFKLSNSTPASYVATQIVAIQPTATAGAENTAVAFFVRTTGSLAEIARIQGGASQGIATNGRYTMGTTAGGTNVWNLNYSAGIANYNVIGPAFTHNFAGGTPSTTAPKTHFTISPVSNAGVTNSAAPTETAAFIHNSHTRIYPSQSGATGLATHRDVQFLTTTLQFNGGAQTITAAAGLYVEAPTAGTGMTLTNSYAAWFNAKCRFDGAVALGGGAAPTLGTIGGTGPATAAQNEWLPVATQNGQRFIPLWA